MQYESYIYMTAYLWSPDLQKFRKEGNESENNKITDVYKKNEAYHPVTDRHLAWIGNRIGSEEEVICNQRTSCNGDILI